MVTCLECGEERKSLGAHLARKHALGVSDYRKKYGEEVDIGYTIAHSEKFGEKKAQTQERQAETDAAYNPADSVKDKLSASELKEYEKRFSLLFRQADDDPALEPAIREVVLNEILVLRCQDQIASISRRIADGKARKDELGALSSLQKLVKETQEVNLKQMTALGLTRQAKQQSRKSVESTPSRWANALLKLAQNWTPEQTQRNNQDMDEAARRLRNNLEKLSDLAVYDAVTGDPADEIKIEV